MKTIAVTGGIGSGKSNFCALLKERGYPVLDADILSKEVLFSSEVSSNDRSLEAEGGHCYLRDSFSWGFFVLGLPYKKKGMN